MIYLSSSTAGDKQMTFGFEEDDNDDADDDASVIGERNAAFHMGRNLSRNRLKDRPRYNRAGRMLLSSRSSCETNASSLFTPLPLPEAPWPNREPSRRRTNCDKVLEIQMPAGLMSVSQPH